MRLLAITMAALLALAGCGADGEPEPPAPKPEPGLTISGTAEIGVSGGS